MITSREKASEDGVGKYKLGKPLTVLTNKKGLIFVLLLCLFGQAYNKAWAGWPGWLGPSEPTKYVCEQRNARSNYSNSFTAKKAFDRCIGEVGAIMPDAISAWKDYRKKLNEVQSRIDLKQKYQARLKSINAKYAKEAREVSDIRSCEERQRKSEYSKFQIDCRASAQQTILLNVEFRRDEISTLGTLNEWLIRQAGLQNHRFNSFASDVQSSAQGYN